MVVAALPTDAVIVSKPELKTVEEAMTVSLELLVNDMLGFALQVQSPSVAVGVVTGGADASAPTPSELTGVTPDVLYINDPETVANVLRSPVATTTERVFRHYQDG